MDENTPPVDDGNTADENSPSVGEMVAPGELVARWRFIRKMSQEQLAEASGLAVATVKAIERGARHGRMDTLNALARALKVRTTQLLAPAPGTSVNRLPAPDALLAIRQALTPPVGLPPPIGRAPDRAAFRDTLRYAQRLYSADRYDAALAAVPVLLEEARALHAADPARADLLIRAHLYAGRMLTQVRQLDLANLALGKAMDLAQSLSDELLAAWTVDVQCWTLLLQRRFAETEELALRTAETIEPRMSEPASVRLATWGSLMVRAGSAAVRDARVDEAVEYMSQARAAATRVGDEVRSDDWMPPPIRAFNMTEVGRKDVENAVLVREFGQALELAKGLPPSKDLNVNSRDRHRLDLASSHFNEHRHREATETLLTIRSTSPTWIKHQGYARDLIQRLWESRRRALTDEIGLLADHVGLAV